MRRRGRIRRLGGGLSAALAASLLVSSAASADSSEVWLPPPREEIEAEERLEEPPSRASGHGAVLARLAASARGAWRMRRVAASWERDPTGTRRRGRAVSLSVVGADGGPRPTVALTAGEFGVAAGRLAADRAPWLLSRSLGLARSFARVPEARAVPLRAAAPAGGTTPAADGIAVEWAGRAFLPWILAARRVGDGSPLGVAGATVRRDRGDAALAVGRTGTRWLLSAAGTRRGDRAASSVELLLAAGRPALLASATARRAEVELWCRWRYQAGEARPVAGEGGAVLRGRRGSARLTWRAWTPAARTDNGALELECVTSLGPGRPIRARVGERPSARASPGPSPPGRDAAERFALIDATLARAGSRSLALLASARGGAREGRAGRMLGARLRAGEGGASRLTFLVQATRSGAGAPALGHELNASGEATLAERTRSGIVLAARGIARRGPLELGGVWEREEGAGGARPRSASIWVRWFL